MLVLLSILFLLQSVRSGMFVLEGEQLLKGPIFCFLFDLQFFPLNLGLGFEYLLFYFVEFASVAVEEAFSVFY